MNVGIQATLSGHNAKKEASAEFLDIVKWDAEPRRNFRTLCKSFGQPENMPLCHTLSSAGTVEPRTVRTVGLNSQTRK